MSLENMSNEHFISKINQLPELEREILRLRISYRSRWNDISKRLNTSENSCKGIYSEVLKKVRNTLRKYL